MSAPPRDIQESMFPDLVPARPQGWIMPSVFGGTNAELIAAVAPMYLTGSVLDVTYGEGKWWERFRPDPFTRHDKFTFDGVDFRALPEDDASIDTVCFDPPYVVSGGESSDALGSDFQDRYGISSRHIGNSVKEFESLLLDGLAECIRVSRTSILVKCMEFAQGSYKGFHDVPHMVTSRALELGCVKHDQIVHHTGHGPGGHNIFVPKRARRHHSYLLVFRKLVFRKGVLTPTKPTICAMCGKQLDELNTTDDGVSA